MAAVFVLNILCVFPLWGQKTQSKTTTTYVKVVFQPNGELTAGGITENRDLAKYVDGGFFDCRGWIDAQKRQLCDEHKLRDFIWKQWHEKSRGYVRVTYDSVDAVSTSHIFIEPDKSGNWSVKWRIARWHALPGGSNQITNIENIAAVEQSGNIKTYRWFLVFKNEAGAIIERIPDR